VAWVFATSSAFVSCNDNDSDVQSELLGKIAELQKKIDAISTIQGPKGDPGEPGAPGQNGQDGQDGQDGVTPHIGDNGNWFIGDTDTGVKAQGEDGQPGTSPSIDDIIAALQGQLDQIKADATKAATEAATEAALKALEEQIQKITDILKAIFKTQVTSLNIDAIKNPIFGFISVPVDLQSNILVTCYGYAGNDIEFPANSGQYIASAGDILVGGTGNAGKIYVTVNPSSTNFAGKTLLLENTAGEPAPVALSPLTESKEVLAFGVTRGATGFYEADATINANNIGNAYISFPHNDMMELKDEIIEFFKKRSKETFKAMAVDLYKLYANNKLTAYRLKATWGPDCNTFSETKIAALAVKPLSYSFDPDGAANTKELEKVEQTFFYTDVDISASSTSAIGQFLDKFNKFVVKGIDHTNWALQPCLLVRDGKIISNIAGDTPQAFDGDIQILMTSRSGELLAPAYKKYLRIISSDKGIELEKTYEGTVKEVPFVLRSGIEYGIKYEAVDYDGVVRTKYYTICGK
jgi:hypothetical protein